MIKITAHVGTLSVTYIYMLLSCSEVRKQYPVPQYQNVFKKTDENCILGYFASSNGNPLPKFRDNLSVPSSRDSLEDGTDRFSRNVGEYLPQLAA